MADLHDRPGRLPAEVAHEAARGPLDRADWPAVGDEVLYHLPTGGWVPAVVVQVAEHDGDLRLDIGDGSDMHALDVKHGAHAHGWLLYRESAALLSGTAAPALTGEMGYTGDEVSCWACGADLPCTPHDLRRNTSPKTSGVDLP